jgi:hypothetical protein
MIDVIFSPALPCGIAGSSCQSLAQGGLIIEDRRRLDGESGFGQSALDAFHQVPQRCATFQFTTPKYNQPSRP